MRGDFEGKEQIILNLMFHCANLEFFFIVTTKSS